MGGAVTGGVCGGLFNGDDRFTVGGKFATMAIAGTYTQGQDIDITVQIYTNHVRPCDTPSFGACQCFCHGGPVASKNRDIAAEVVPDFMHLLDRVVREVMCSALTLALAAGSGGATR